MKITDIKLHVLQEETAALVTSHDGLFKDSGPSGTIKYSLVRIITDEKIEGHYIVWSEVATGRPAALAEVLRNMKPLIVGEDPFHRERIWQKLASLWYGQRGPALAAVDIALWDIAGKAANLPLYKLIGGYRDKVRAYASGNVVHDKDEVVRIAKDCVRRGYTALKLHPIPVEIFSAVRDAVGDAIDLIYDAVFSHSRREALAVGKELQRLNAYWYEAPLPPDDIEGYVELHRRLDVPITVELTHSREYREYIQRNAVDYLRTLSGITGGITDMKKAANLCEAFGMNWEPHSYGGTMYQAANLHVILSTKNCTLFELPIEQGKEGHFDVGTKNVLRIDSEGYVHAPAGPGLGIELDWDQVNTSQEIEL